MGHEKLYGICENKCFVEVLPKTEAATKDYVDEKVEDTAITYKGITSGTEFYLGDTSEWLRPMPWEGKYCLINDSDQDVAIKLLGYIQGVQGETVKIKCNRNGAEEEQTTTTIGTYGSMPLTETKFDFTFFTLKAGRMAIFEYLSYEKV